MFLSCLLAFLQKSGRGYRFHRCGLGVKYKFILRRPIKAKKSSATVMNKFSAQAQFVRNALPVDCALITELTNRIVKAIASRKVGFWLISVSEFGCSCLLMWFPDLAMEFPPTRGTRHDYSVDRCADLAAGPFMGLSSNIGAAMPDSRRPAVKVVVFHDHEERPFGTALHSSKTL